MTIRAIQAGLFAGVLASVAGGAFAQPADSGPVRIGLVLPKQGPAAAIGEYLQRGSELAVEEAGRKVLGRPVELVWLDESSPQVAQQNMQKLIQENKVVAIVGGNSSADTLAMMSVAAREKVPMISPGSSASEITGTSCNRYTFRTQAPVRVQIHGVMPYVSQIGKRIYFLTPSYALGQDILRVGRSTLKDVGATEVGFDEVPVGTADYSSYVLKIRQANPSAVIGGLVGTDASNFLKQWSEMGMKNKAPYVAVGATDSDFWEIGAQAVSGIYVKPWYYKDPKNPPSEKKMTADFEKKYGRPPSDKAWSGWIAMRALLESITQAKSTDPKAIVTALEKWRDTEGAIPVYFREWDHQLIKPAVIVGVKKQITDKWDFFDILSLTSANEADTAKSFGTKEEVGCNMPAL